MLLAIDVTPGCHLLSMNIKICQKQRHFQWLRILNLAATKFTTAGMVIAIGIVGNVTWPKSQKITLTMMAQTEPQEVTDSCHFFNKKTGVIWRMTRSVLNRNIVRSMRQNTYSDITTLATEPERSRKNYGRSSI